MVARRRSQYTTRGAGCQAHFRPYDSLARASTAWLLGFVQVAWRPAEGLPARIEEEIDADADGQADFRIELETATEPASLTPYSPDVLALEAVYDLGETLAVRVRLENPRR